MSNFTAPQGGNSKKIDVPLLEPGQYLVSLYGLTDLGTQDSKYYDAKRQICLSFETSQEQAVFWEGDGPKPYAIQAFKTFSMYKDAGLRKDFVENMIARKLSDQEADSFDFSSLLGKQFVASIIHSKNEKYMDITSIAPLDSKNMKMFDLTEPRVDIINPMYFFHINDGFESENFKSLPKFLRDMLKESHEGQAFIRAGKTFNEPEQNSAASGSPQSPPTAGRTFKMKPGQQYTREQYHASGWTDQQLVDQGMAEWLQPATPPAPAGPPASAPAPAPAPSAPPVAAAPPVSAPPVSAPPVAAAPPASTGDNHPIIMRSPELQSQIDAYLAKNWTYELLVDNALADWKKDAAGNPIHGTDDLAF